ncbi:uncharacterized protein [Petaurus breviceps papuanus]|uniref:uncharacterized protein isoform X2 n=1 Tax=Petaurus breviceps papuanus TaxID=3040969 RepID=UPI0036DE6F1A
MMIRRTDCLRQRMSPSKARRGYTGTHPPESTVLLERRCNSRKKRRTDYPTRKMSPSKAGRGCTGTHPPESTVLLRRCNSRKKRTQPPRKLSDSKKILQQEEQGEYSTGSHFWN